MSLTLHVVAGTATLYLSSTSFLSDKMRTKNISVEVVSISEFDAQISSAPDIENQNLVFKRLDNFPDLSQDDFQVVRMGETGVRISKQSNLSVPKKRQEMITEVIKGDPSFISNFKEKAQNHDVMGNKSQKKMEQLAALERVYFSIGSSSKKTKIKSAGSINDEEMDLLPKTRPFKIDFIDKHNVAASTLLAQPISSDNFENLQFREKILDELNILDLDITSFKRINIPANVFKPIKNNFTADSKLVQNENKITKQDLLNGYIQIPGEKLMVEVSMIETAQEVFALERISTDFSNMSSEQPLSYFQHSVQEKPRVLKDNVVEKLFAKPSEQPISGNWGAAIEQKVLSNLVYPQKARNKYLSGKVLLKLEIFSDGTILNVLIRQSSGHIILDRAAKDAVVRSIKFPAAPDDYPNKKYIFNLPVKFNA